jgi:hypothetical protein
VAQVCNLSPAQAGRLCHQAFPEFAKTGGSGAAAKNIIANQQAAQFICFISLKKWCKSSELHIITGVRLTLERG